MEKKIKIPEGSYEIDDIYNTIHHDLKTINEDYYINISANSNTLKSVLILEDDYQVEFNHQHLTGVNAGIITLYKMFWFMPHVETALKEKVELHKIIERKEKLAVGYRMIQCDSVSVPLVTSYSWRVPLNHLPKYQVLSQLAFRLMKAVIKSKIHLHSTT